MKNFVAFVAAAAVVVGSVTCGYAANGDVCGKIYSTDIMAYINGKAVPSYNIGGRTAIILEELYEQGYGIYNEYNDETRTLKSKGEFSLAPEESISAVTRGSVGKILGDVYESDIKVFFNGNEIKGYNIGGKTAVLIEDLGEKDDSPNEEYGYSKYLANYVWNGDDRTISLNVLNTQDTDLGFPWYRSELLPNTRYVFKDNIVTADYNRFYTYRPSAENELSEEILSKPYTLMPLYYSDGETKTQVGVMYVGDDGNVIPLCSERDALLKLCEPLAGTPMANEELFSYLDNKTDYETMEKIETDDFWFVVAKKPNENTAYGISVSKNGGYGCVWTEDADKTTVKKSDGNVISVNIYPFAGPHGMTTMHYETNLDDYTVR